MTVKMKRADFVGSILLLIFCALAFLETFKFTESAALLPRIILGCIAILSAMQLIRTYIKKTDKVVTLKTDKLGKMVLLTLFYALSMVVIGYYAATFLYIMACMYVFGVRSKLSLVCVPAGFCLFTALCFVRFLSLRLPEPFFL